MQIRTTPGSGGAGLGIIGTGLALAFPEAKWAGFLLMAAGGAVFVFDVRIERGRIRAKGKNLQQIGPFLLIFLAPLLGLAWLYFQKDTASALARLAELGWVVQSQQDFVQFSTSSTHVPSMADSAPYFGRIDKKFKLTLQNVDGIDGLHLISNLSNCDTIALSAGSYSNISEISQFKNLKHLYITQIPLEGTQTVDLAPLSSLTELTELSLSDTRARNAAPIAHLHKLEKLFLKDTLINDISMLGGLTALTVIDVSGTRIDNLSVLTKYPSLRSLVISGAQAAHLPENELISQVTLIDNTASDLTGLKAFKNLQELTIIGVPSIDADFLQNLTKLKTLQINAFGLGALSPALNIQRIANLSDLQILVLGNLAINDLTFLSAMRNLKQINLWSIPIRSIDFMSRMPTWIRLS